MTLVRFAKFEKDYLKDVPNCYFIQHFGVLQHHYGNAPNVEKALRGGRRRMSPSPAATQRSPTASGHADGVHPGRIRLHRRTVLRRVLGIG
jgi:hypothetical protein